MKCQDISELITAVLDGELRADERPILDDHLRECAQCRNELELHSMAKRVVQQRLKRVTTPPEVAAAIWDNLNHPPAREPLVSIKNLLPFRITRKPLIAFAGVVALILVAVIYRPHPPQPAREAYTGPSEADIIQQTYTNYDHALAGTLTPQVKSRNPEDVKEFLAQRASFSVSVPKMKQYNLMGGSVSKFLQAPVAHVMYKKGESMIYMYQVKLADVLNENNVILPTDIKQELLENCTYVRSRQPNSTMLIKIIDSTVCCFVADLPREELIRYIEETH